MEELLPVLLITLSAIFQYCKSQVITNFITICEPLYFRWNQSCGDLSDKSDDGNAIYITFNDINHAMMAEKPAKKFAACSEFLLCFIYFLISMLIVVALSLLVAFYATHILVWDDFAWKTDERCKKIDIEVMNTWKSCMWTMERKIKWRMIIICRKPCRLIHVKFISAM